MICWNTILVCFVESCYSYEVGFDYEGYTYSQHWGQKIIISHRNESWNIHSFGYENHWEKAVSWPFLGWDLLFCRSSRRTNTLSSLAMATLPSGQLKPVSVDYLTSIRHPRPLQPGILRDLDRKSWGVVVGRFVLILTMDHVFLFGRGTSRLNH